MTEPDRWITVPNWDDFQHYKDRSPPWIKLHASILYDDDFIALTPARQAILVKLLVAYSQAGAKVRADTTSVSQIVRQRVTASDLAELERGGFIARGAAPVQRRSGSGPTPVHPPVQPRSDADAEPVYTLRNPDTTTETHQPQPTDPDDASIALASRKHDASAALAFARSRESEAETEAEEPLFQGGSSATTRSEETTGAAPTPQQAASDTANEPHPDDLEPLPHNHPNNASHRPKLDMSTNTIHPDTLDRCLTCDELTRLDELTTLGQCNRCTRNHTPPTTDT